MALGGFVKTIGRLVGEPEAPRLGVEVAHGYGQDVIVGGAHLGFVQAPLGSEVPIAIPISRSIGQLAHQRL